MMMYLRCFMKDVVICQLNGGTIRTPGKEGSLKSDIGFLNFCLRGRSNLCAHASQRQSTCQQRFTGVSQGIDIAQQNVFFTVSGCEPILKIVMPLELAYLYTMGCVPQLLIRVFSSGMKYHGSRVFSSVHLQS